MKGRCECIKASGEEEERGKQKEKRPDVKREREEGREGQTNSKGASHKWGWSTLQGRWRRMENSAAGKGEDSGGEMAFDMVSQPFLLSDGAFVGASVTFMLVQLAQVEYKHTMCDIKN